MTLLGLEGGTGEGRGNVYLDLVVLLLNIIYGLVLTRLVRSSTVPYAASLGCNIVILFLILGTAGLGA